MKPLVRAVRSSLGSKYVMALTGLALTLFVLVHMAGNLLVYSGPDALNSYANALKARPALLWSFRLGLLAVFLIHVVLGIRLTRQNVAARPVRYVREATEQATWASRHMLLTGLALLAFIAYHLAHFTFGAVQNAHLQVVHADTGTREVPVDKNYLQLTEVRRPGTKGYVADPYEDLGNALARGEDVRHDVYSMVVSGFRNPWISLSYLVAMVLLGLHLWHGGSSWFQSLGINHPAWNRPIKGFGPFLATVVVLGNCSMPLAVWAGLVR
jgi:succinate dehydrogenase / fumarate reductase, cytochrome b subunit